MMKKKVNKSAVIRELISKSPGISASEILAQLKKDGITVSPPLVYQTLNRSASPKVTGKKRGRKPSSAPVSAKATSNNDLLTALQAFVNAAGSVDQAIAIMNVFKK
jgi:arginine repressor